MTDATDEIQFPENQQSEKVEETDTEDANPGGRAGETVGIGVAGTFNLIGLSIFNFFAAFFRVLPGARHLWRGVAKMALYNHYKKHGGDRTGLTHRPNGQIELEPVKWDPAEDELKKEPGYQSVRRDKTFAAGASGRADVRLGKTPIVLLDEDFATKGSMIESRVMEAIELDKDRPLFTNPEIRKVEVDAQALSGQQPVADGGFAERDLGDELTSYYVDDEGVLEDTLIDIGTGDAWDGQAVSFDRFTDKFAEQAPTERLQMAETRGYLAGMDPDKHRSLMLKIMLIGAAVALGGLIGPELINALFGGGGGGGSALGGVL